MFLLAPVGVVVRGETESASLVTRFMTQRGAAFGCFFVNSLRAAGVVKKVFVQKNDIRISSSIVSGNSRRLPFTRGHMRSPTGG